MNWIYEKYKGNGAIYARCDECKFEYCCSSYNVSSSKSDIDNVYNYCPNCGRKASNTSGQVYVIVNRRCQGETIYEPVKMMYVDDDDVPLISLDGYALTHEEVERMAKQCAEELERYRSEQL